MKIKCRILLPLIFTLFWQSLPGQTQNDTKSVLVAPDPSIGSDSNFIKQQDYINDLYHQVMYGTNEILNGKEYEFYFFPPFSFPLIPERPDPTASLTIRGNTYENLMLQYDTYKDELVYFDPKNIINNVIFPIAINKYIIDEFTLKLPDGDLKFQYLKYPDDPKGKKSGYYEIIFNGNCKLLIKHKCDLVEEYAISTYKYRPDRYVVNENIFYKIRGKKSLLTAFGDQKTAMKKYIKASKISVKNASNQQLRGIVEHYNSLLLP